MPDLNLFYTSFLIKYKAVSYLSGRFQTKFQAMLGYVRFTMSEPNYFFNNFSLIKYKLMLFVSLIPNRITAHVESMSCMEQHVGYENVYTSYMYYLV